MAWFSLWQTTIGGALHRAQRGLQRSRMNLRASRSSRWWQELRRVIDRNCSSADSAEPLLGSDILREHVVKCRPRPSPS